MTFCKKQYLLLLLILTAGLWWVELAQAQVSPHAVVEFETKSYSTELKPKRGDDNYIADAITLEDGSIIFGVGVYSGLGSPKVRLAKFDDATNRMIWSKRVSESETSVIIEDLEPALDGGFYALSSYKPGGVGRDILIQKFDENGFQLWKKGFGNKKDDFPFSVKESASGSLFIVGTSKSGPNGKKDAFITNLSSGDKEVKWWKFLGGKKDDALIDLVIDQSERIVAVGSKWESGKKAEFLAAEFNLDGEILSELTWGTKADDKLSNIVVAKNGDFLVSGGSTFAPFQHTLTRLSKNMERKWSSRTPGNTLNLLFNESQKTYDGFSDLIETQDGSIISLIHVAFSKNPENKIVAHSGTGNLLWSENFGKHRLSKIASFSGDHLKILGSREKDNGMTSDEMYPAIFVTRPFKDAAERIELENLKRRQRLANKGDGWGAAFASALRVTTGALIDSGSIEDADTLAYVGMANVASNAMTAESQGKSAERIQRESEQVASGVSSQIKENSDRRVAEINANTARIEASKNTQDLMSENEALKLELENARMKAELQRLRSAESVQGKSPQSEFINDDGDASSGGQGLSEGGSSLIKVYSATWSHNKDECGIDSDWRYSGSTKVIREEWLWYVIGLADDSINNYAQISGPATRSDGARRVCIYEFYMDNQREIDRYNNGEYIGYGNTISFARDYYADTPEQAFARFKDAQSTKSSNAYTSLRSACEVVTNRRGEYCDR